MDDPQLTQLIRKAAAGDTDARAAFVTLVHDEIHRLARNQLRWQPRHSLQVTDVVNETYLKLFPANSPPTNWNDRQHFFAVAAEAIRCILADHARKRGRLKRKPTGERVLLDDLLAAYDDKDIDVVAVHEALQELEKLDKRMVRIVDLRVFGGYLNKEIAELLDISLRTVEREWSIARAWLRDRMSGDIEGRGGTSPPEVGA